MVYCAELRAAFATAARRDAVRQDIEQRIVGRPRFDAAVTRIASVDLSFRIAGGQHGLIVEGLRFTARADAEDLLSRVRAFASGQRAPLAGSRVAIHDCTHDGTGGPCSEVPAEVTEW